ncbi:hypothetical protein GUITHDRAFT_133129 [Guillardia theta CCMP2712]|uniref:Uncharacterized protein n=2 Tax=Guillardia theta TaxID=55529 RepID=L1JYK0_GUITC|nr:hypothetical protein GUITHDRAFT_133129 [Guillardia theta CCMP2712]EKX53409.1 hypothetical protein GUITHDRAFT_133129 [Guillardia theta CCMP2712]|eukprot:XP_005840389.1 hypothetical protein GUITHDRAFT_133129 [Guillardia theta CCMP2712]
MKFVSPQSRGSSPALLLLLLIWGPRASSEKGVGQTWIGDSFLEIEIERVPREFRHGEVMNVAVTMVGDGRSLAMGASPSFIVFIDHSPIKDEDGATTIHKFPPLNQYNESGYTLQLLLTQLAEGWHWISVGVLDLDQTSHRVVYEIGLDFTVVGAFSSMEQDALKTSVSKCIAPSSTSQGCRDYVQLRLSPLSPFLTRTELAMLKNTAESYFGHVIDEGLLEMFPWDYEKSAFESCAVVGSSGHLLGSGFGRDIDVHDLVIRFNDAPAGGEYESDVGSRTTHRVLHSSGKILEFLHANLEELTRNNETLLFRGDWKPDIDKYFQLIHPIVAEDVCNESKCGRIRIFSTYFNLLVWRWIGARGADCVPSSGMIGIMWALQSCLHVDTYGFGRHPSVRQGPRTRYKYYGEVYDVGDAGHNWNLEEELHDRLQAAGLLVRNFG